MRQKIVYILLIINPYLSFKLQGQEYLETTTVLITNSIGNQIQIGAGVIIDQKKSTTYILTAYHVIKKKVQDYDQKHEINIQFFKLKSETFKAKIIGLDEENDLALLSVKMANKKFPSLRQANWDNIGEGDKLVIVGHPLEKEWFINRKEILINKKQGLNTSLFTFSPDAVKDGVSGGPIFTEENCFAGIVSQTGSIEAIGIKSSLIANFLEPFGLSLTPHECKSTSNEKNSESIRQYKKLPKVARLSLYSGAAVTLGFGFIFSKNSKNDYQTYKDHRINSDPIYSNLSRDNLFKRAKRRKDWANILWGSAGIFLVASISDQTNIFGKTLFYKVKKIDQEARIEIKPSALNLCDNYYPTSSHALGLKLTIGF